MLSNIDMKKSSEIRRDNLLIAISRMGTAANLAAKAAISAAYLSQIKNRTPESKTGKPKTMGDDVARRIESVLGVQEGWMDSQHPTESIGIGDRAVHEKSKDDQSSYNAGPAQQVVQGKWVAIVGIGQGGPDGFISIDDYAPGSGDGFIYTYSQDANAYAIRVRGDSMRPRIKSGEYIVAEPTIESQPGDDVVVMRKDGRALVKELLWIRDDEASLGSINNGIPPITIPLREIKSIHRVAAIVPRGSALIAHERPEK